MSRRSRFGSTVLAGALLALLLAPSLAGACNEPKIGLAKAAAGSGDTVRYTITNAAKGATYTLSVEGHDLGGGTSTSVDGHSGSFTMPDLGSPRRVSVELVVTHPDEAAESEPTESGPARHVTSPEPDYESIDFTVPTPATAQAPAAAAAPRDSSPAQASEQAAPSATASAPAPAGGARVADPRPASTERARAGSGATQAATRSTSGARGTVAAPPTVAAPVNAARPAPVAAPAGARVTPAVTRGTTARAAATVPAATIPPAAIERPLSPAPFAVAGTAGGADAHPLLLAAIALALCLLAQIGCAWSRLRPRAPALPVPLAATRALVLEDHAAPDVEAELQELIAEARAARDFEREPARS